MSRNIFLLDKLKSLAYVLTGGTGLFSAISIYQGNENFYEKFLLPAGHWLNPETSHNIAVVASKYGLIPRSRFKDPCTLGTQVWQLAFQNPVGLAAGFDKQGEAVAGLHRIGFGFVEIGSVTPEPQPGNDKPRVFRLAQNEAIINRYGFNSDGHDDVLLRLRSLKLDPNFEGIVGVNLGKNKASKDPIDDYIKGVEKFGGVADYLVINISSPNTPGLREWQKKEHLKELLRSVVTARNKLQSEPLTPLLLKLAPDLSDQDKKDIADVISDPKCRIDGLVISNTTVERSAELIGPHTNEVGGLSGRPLTASSTALISEMYRLTNGKIPIIGVGGVFTGKDAYDKIKAGASLIQLYTSFVYHGPPRISRIKKELDALIKDDGYSNISEAVGKGATTQRINNVN